MHGLLNVLRNEQSITEIMEAEEADFKRADRMVHRNKVVEIFQHIVENRAVGRQRMTKVGATSKLKQDDVWRA